MLIYPSHLQCSNPPPSLHVYLLFSPLSTVILAPLVGGVAGSTILPLLLATLLAYCSTGYVRDELYHPLVKACVGSCCSSIVIVLTFFYLVLWLCFTVLYTMIMTVYVQLSLGCREYDDRRNLGNTCTRLYEATDAVYIQSCGVMDSICSDGQKVGLSLSISLAFALLVVIGLALVLIVQSANFIRVRECEKRSYRPKGDY
jgi:hypothetical protein